MSPALAGRNNGYVPGQALRDRVLIPEWEKRSVWGWDADTGSLYAQLWQNTDVGGADAGYGVDGRTQRLLHPGQLALELLDMTSLTALALIDGLGLGSAQVLGDRSRAGDLLQQPSGPPSRSEGRTWCAQWITGKSTRCPGSPLPWLRGVLPTAQIIDAEHVYAVGRLAQVVSRPGRRHVADQRAIQRLKALLPSWMRYWSIHPPKG